MAVGTLSTLLFQSVASGEWCSAQKNLAERNIILFFNNRWNEIRWICVNLTQDWVAVFGSHSCFSVLRDSWQETTSYLNPCTEIQLCVPAERLLAKISDFRVVDQYWDLEWCQTMYWERKCFLQDDCHDWFELCKVILSISIDIQSQKPYNQIWWRSEKVWPTQQGKLRLMWCILLTS